MSGIEAVIAAAVISLAAHFAVGAAKSLITVRSWWSSGLEMTVVGAVEGAVTYGIGILLGQGRNVMAGFIPLGDASRGPRRSTAITILIIAVNVFLFYLELRGGNRFIRTWSAIPLRITTGITPSLCLLPCSCTPGGCTSSAT